MQTLTLDECFQILQISRKASLEELKRAYRRRAFELHPDLHPDNKYAHAQFQQLNEAYVLLSSVVKPTNNDSSKTNSNHQSKGKNSDSNTNSNQWQNAEPSPDGAQKDPASNKQDTKEQHSDSAKRQQRAQAYQKADILRDLLNDPFARRVFADIYSELSKQQEEKENFRKEPSHGKKEKTSEQTPPTKTKLRKIPFEWGEKKKKISSGLKGTISDWLKKQIDDFQTMAFSKDILRPGIRIRLQIHHAFAEKPSTIEVTLPPDFVPGKPIRLRGLGKKIGPWQGDLYLTLEAK